MISRRGPGQMAGKLCQRTERGKDKTGAKLCTKYARYAVVWQDDAARKMVILDGVCGAHLADAVRECWQKQHVAAIVQEIPGMWRGLT